MSSGAVKFRRVVNSAAMAAENRAVEDAVGDGIDSDTVDLNFCVEEALDGAVEGRGGEVVVDRDLEMRQSSCGGGDLA